LLLVIFVATGIAFYGPNSLPDRIATHYDALGQPDAWTTRGSLSLLPVIAVIVYLALSVAAVYSSLAKQAAQNDPGNAPLMGTLVLKLISGIKAELMGVFNCIQMSSLYTARNPDAPSSLWSAGAWVLLVGILATIAWFVMNVVRVQRRLEAA